MRYEERMIRPFREELTAIGFKELRTAGEVDAEVGNTDGTSLVVVNSVCGCAAGKARPGIAMALKQSALKPDRLTTVFAGGDVEATARLREHLGDIPPSSPSLALFKEGRLVHFIPRHEIQNHDAQEISQSLQEAFQQFCGSARPAAKPTA